MTEREDPVTSPVVEELVRLAGAVQQWAVATFPPAADGAGTAAHAHGTTCDWCPLCQFVAVLRGERPDLTARVAEAGAALTAAARALLDALPAPEPGVPGTAASDAAGDRPEPSSAPRVQRVELADEP